MGSESEMHIVNANSLAKNPVQAVAAHSQVTDRYGFVSSQFVLNAFADAGWLPVEQKALKTRKADRAGFQKHLIRMENPEYLDVPGLDGNWACRPQLVFINSHDRASSMRLTWGMLRFVCLNGLIVGDTVGEVRLKHSNNVMQRLPDAIQAVLSSFPKLIEQTQTLRAKTLTQAAVDKLVKTVYDARLDGVKNLERVDYRLPLLRREDASMDAFTVFNRVQEVALRGGIVYTYNRQFKDGNGNVVQTHLSHHRTRAVTAIDESVRLNQLAYDTALELV
jgi:hypothetical protein